MKYTKENIKNTRTPIEYLFFWGHQPSKDGSVSKSCFSQWWIAGFDIDGIRYKTAEHFMMAEKARVFEDDEMREKIIACESPHEAKKMGRKVINFDYEIWMSCCYEIVKKGNFHKFGQNENLQTYLLSTGNKILVEASPVDAVWGIGMAENHKNAMNPDKWRGENLLGFALMEVRDELKNN
ncbi:MAG: NADAR family protein [Flavobacteriales bacterium]